MLHSYFVAYSYQRHGDGGWSFDNYEVTTEQPMEESAVREAVTQHIAANLSAICPGYYKVILSNWILLNSHFSAEARAHHQQRALIDDQFNEMKITYFVAYSASQIGSANWYFGNATATIDQHIELDVAREFIPNEIAKHLFMEFGGEHKVVINNWKLLRREYPTDSRALSKM